MKTQDKAKEKLIDDIVGYVNIEGMSSVEAEILCEEIELALYEYFNPEEE